MWRFQKCCLSLTLRTVMQERLNACYSLRHTYEESRKFLLYMHSFVLSLSIKGRILISENTSFYLFEKRPCHGSGGQSLAFHSGGPCSPPESVHCDLWLTTWHLDSFLSEFFGFFFVNNIPPRISIFMYYMEDEQQAVGGRSSETVSPHRHEQQLEINCSPFENCGCW
jgi:hypothetical protein